MQYVAYDLNCAILQLNFSTQSLLCFKPLRFLSKSFDSDIHNLNKLTSLKLRPLRITD